MNSKHLLLRACWLLFAGITPVLGQGIDGTWHLNGFYTEGDADTPLPPTEAINGTVTISVETGSITFNTNLRNWTESDGFSQTGDVYRMVSPPTGDPEEMIAIRVIDEDTLAVSFGDIWLRGDGFDIQGTEGLAGVLTKNPLPAPDPGNWTGSFAAKGMILKEVENDGDAVRLQQWDLGMAVAANANSTSYRLIEDDPDDESDYADNMVPVGNALHWEDYGSSDHILWDDSFITTRHVQTRDQVRFLQLGGGRLAFFIVYNKRAITESSESAYDGIRFISNFEYGSLILTPKDGGSFGDAVADAGLTGDDTRPDATPFGDGVENLLKYAFNMNLAGPDRHRMTPGGSSGLPVGGLVEEGGQTYWRVEYVRRKDGSPSYAPQKSGNLEESGFAPLVGEETVADIPGEPEWERVVIDEPCDPATEDRCFFRVRIELP